MSDPKVLVIRQLGLQDYEPAWQAMSHFTDTRSADTPDELWLLEHKPVFTQGQAGKAEHLLMPGDIPVVQADRGGQVTYHGPGQLVAYPLLDIRRLGFGVRELVNRIEQAIVATLAELDIEAYGKPDAPGVYVKEAKIASLGLRVRRGASFHGLSLNISMDMGPFERINPCGYQGLTMVQVRDLVEVPVSVASIGEALRGHLVSLLGHSHSELSQSLPEGLSAGL